MSAVRSGPPAVGIFQGRLVPSATGELQCHPGDRWAEELGLAGALGFHHVELLMARVRSAEDPVWSAAGRDRLRTVAAAAGVALVSACCEEVLDRSLAARGVAEELADHLAPVAADLGLRIVVLPLFEASAPGAGPGGPLAAGVATVARGLATVGVTVVLELPIAAARSTEFLDAVGVPGVRLCYDLGNATAAGFDPAVEIPVLGARIGHVHAKDKDADGVNVEFGTGRVDFPAAVGALAGIGYTGLVTIEATRGVDPVTTAAAHRAFLLDLFAPPDGSGAPTRS